jgi:adenylate kinase
MGHVFHLKYNPPRMAGICDFDGSELFQREDDKEETVKNRYAVFIANTLPLIEYYRAKGILKEIDGNQSIDQVTEDILAVVEKK